jgi:pimeloyl-ACP methyl ester carboxylesterase
MLSGPAIPIIGDLMRYTLAPLVSWAIFPFLLRAIFSPTQVPLVFEEQFPKSLALRPIALRSAAEESAMMVPCAARAAASYGNLHCPVAIVTGDQDKVVEHEQGRRLHAALPRSVVHNIPRTGHMLHHNVPQRIVAAIDLIKAWPA